MLRKIKDRILLCFLKLASLFFSESYDRRRALLLYKSIVYRSRVKKIKEVNEKEILPKLREIYQKKDRKIRVLFINFMQSRWQYQSLYEALEKDENFEPIVYVTVRNIDRRIDRRGKSKYKEKFNSAIQSFTAKNMNIALGFDIKKDETIDIMEYHPDIVFYQEPWNMNKHFDCRRVAFSALTMMCSYGSSISLGANEFSEIQRFFYKIFLDNIFSKEILLSHYFPENLFKVAGQPKLDEYLKPINYDNQIWKTEGKKRVIYAPHSTCHDDSVMRYGTFDYNHDYFLQLAKEHPEVEFIFKPHPELARKLVYFGIMSQEEVEKYWQAWRELPNAQVYEGGYYFDMFRTSDLMITDCNSFLLEYLPSGKPLIQMIRHNSVGQNMYGKIVTEGYYKAHNREELKRHIQDVLFNGNDPKYDVRQDIIKYDLQQPECGCGEFIHQFLVHLLRD